MSRASVAFFAALMAAATVFAQAAGAPNHSNGNTTRTQSIHAGEPSTTHPGGNPGRTTGRTSSQNPWRGKSPSPATDPTLYPNCLYNTAEYQSGQVTRLRADTLVQGMALTSFNCFAYAETFIQDKFPTSIFGGGNVTLTPKWLGQHNYSMAGAAPTLDQLPPARLGDLVLVQNKDTNVGSYQWYHVAVVVEVDAAGQVARLRQKPDGNRCVSDTTAAQFMTIDPVRNGEQYELWTNPSLQWSQKLAP